MNIKNIPWYDRSGVRSIREGVNSLDTAELFSILILTYQAK